MPGTVKASRTDDHGPDVPLSAAGVHHAANPSRNRELRS